MRRPEKELARPRRRSPESSTADVLGALLGVGAVVAAAYLIDPVIGNNLVAMLTPRRRRRPDAGDLSSKYPDAIDVKP